MIRILFVCTGNICRSPTAEGVFRHLVEKAGMAEHFIIASAGTDAYHVGEPPDPRAVKTALKNGVKLEGQKARPLVPDDFYDFDYIYAMDGGHFYELEDRAPEDANAEIDLFLVASGHPHETDVVDPWYGQEEDFDRAYALVEEGCRALLKKLRKDHML